MSICRDCWNKIEADQPGVYCPNCGTFYHLACWQKNGGCIAGDCGYQGTPAPIAPPAGLQPVEEAVQEEAPASDAPARHSACRKCGAAMENGQIVCPACGALRRRSAAPAAVSESVSQAAEYCPNCGVGLTEKQHFCRKCGYALHPRQPAPQQPVQQEAHPNITIHPDPASVQQKPRFPSLIFAILGLVFSWIPFVFILGLLFDIAGMMLSIAAKKKGGGGKATAGIVCSSIGLFIGLVMTALVLYASGVIY